MGVAFAAALLVVSMFFHDTIEYIENKAYYIDQKFDLLARFSVPQDINNSDLITGIEGVIISEPIIEVPVEIGYNQKTSHVILQGFPADSRMKRIEDEYGQLIPMPSQGVVVGHKTAEKLGLGVGDLVKIETELGIGPNRE